MGNLEQSFFGCSFFFEKSFKKLLTVADYNVTMAMLANND